jgi:xanthine dehydrogenase accessory factor
MLKGEGAGSKMLVGRESSDGSLGRPELDAIAVETARELLADERSETRTIVVDSGEYELFFESFPPPPTLLIFGAVHVAQSLARIAKLTGFRVIVSDARAKLATAERFPDADQIIQAWPDDAINDLTIEPNTYVAILTHDPKFDEPALVGTLSTAARYIGAVGSRKTNADRRERLRAAGVSEDDLARIRGPIGLDIGASTPEEMAISIMAEIISVRHGRTGGMLTGKSGNIRARV